MLPELMLAIQICGTMPSFAGDSLSPCDEDLQRPQQMAQARLYRALRWSAGLPVRVDSLASVGGVQVCFPVDTTVHATYWIVPVNQNGLEPTCWGNGLSFPSTVGADYPSGVDAGEEERFYDLSGRRLPAKPTTPGLYWLKAKGKKARLIRVK